MSSPGLPAGAAWFLLSFAIGTAGTWLARRYAIHRALIDEPGERRSHQVATPRGGGIAIVLAMLVVLCALIVQLPAQIFLLGAIALGLLCVAGIGWVDDHRPLSPWLRLVVHGLACLLLGTGLLLSGTHWSVALAGGVGALVLVNVWNFMDGIDGLAASQAVLVGAGLALFWLPGVGGILAMALAGATCGFLPFNAPRARIFLGDVGSGALGFALAALLALACVRLESFRWPVLLLPVSAFLIDASLTLLTRMVRRERWWTPHVTHAYQRWARRTGHLPVTAGYAVWTLLATGWACIASSRTPAFIMAAVLALFLTGIVAWWWLRNPGGADGQGN